MLTGWRSRLGVRVLVASVKLCFSVDFPRASPADYCVSVVAEFIELPHFDPGNLAPGAHTFRAYIGLAAGAVAPGPAAASVLAQSYTEVLLRASPLCLFSCRVIEIKSTCSRSRERMCAAVVSGCQHSLCPATCPDYLAPLPGP